MSHLVKYILDSYKENQYPFERDKDALYAPLNYCGAQGRTEMYWFTMRLFSPQGKDARLVYICGQKGFGTYMKCKFCGEELKDGANYCENCGKEQSHVASENMKQAEKTVASKIMDSMPELHNELDRIGEMREKRKRRNRRIIFALILILLCVAGVWFGMHYFSGPDRNAQPAGGEMQEPATSGVPGEVNALIMSEGFSQVQIFDEDTALDAIESVKSSFGITDTKVSFTLSNKITVGDDTFYRFGQTYDGIAVSGGEIVVMAAEDGTPLALNGRVVETDGLDVDAELSSGAASNAISEYVNKMAADYNVKEGVNLTDVEKVVCNFQGFTYLAYTANVSGYNENGEYTAFDVFIDADTGAGIFVRDTASYENESEEEPAQEQEQSEIPQEEVFEAPVLDSQSVIYSVNDKFNWNDETMTSALDEIRKEDIEAGAVSDFVSVTKTAVDKAYTYFAENFGYQGFVGKDGKRKVYLNPNEYLEDDLPPDSALYTNGIIMFIQEDLTSGELDFNTAVHEYAHGVIDSVANLDGTRAKTENAAIAEGYADVFAELAEAYYRADKSADWVHGERNMTDPQGGYFAKIPEKIEIATLNDCYLYSTILSHAVYQMNANGVDVDALGELMFKSMCLLTEGSDFSQWRSVTEFMARNMANTGRMTEEQFAAVTAALDNTGIKGERLYAKQVDAIADGDIPDSETQQDDSVFESADYAPEDGMIGTNPAEGEINEKVIE